MVDNPMIEPWMHVLVEQAVQRAVSRYEGGLPNAAIEEMRRLLRLGLYNDPEAQRLLRVMAPRPPVESSHKVEVRNLTAGDDPEGGAWPEPASTPGGRGGRR
jgi:hypothetical protein